MKYKFLVYQKNRFPYTARIHRNGVSLCWRLYENEIIKVAPSLKRKDDYTFAPTNHTVSWDAIRAYYIDEQDLFLLNIKYKNFIEKPITLKNISFIVQSPSKRHLEKGVKLIGPSNYH